MGTKVVAGTDRIFYFKDCKNSGYPEYGNVKYILVANVEVYSKSQPLILPGLSRSAFKFTVY